jgi:hypothetical protein
MEGFRYPKDDKRLLVSHFANDFLRTTEDFPGRVDFNYLRNQRDAANHFLNWFDGAEDKAFGDMIRECHRLAAVGESGRVTYSIRWGEGIWIKPALQDGGTITFETGNRDWHRHTFPSVFRTELKTRGISHPEWDLLELEESQIQALEILGAESAVSRVRWCRLRKRPVPKAEKKACYIVRFEGAAVTCRVLVSEVGVLARKAPVGRRFDDMMALCESRMDALRKWWRYGCAEDASRLITLYYHAMINWMPFSNINNSIFMAHVNSMRRLAGMAPQSHGCLDTLALLTSSKGFLELVK